MKKYNIAVRGNNKKNNSASRGIKNNNPMNLRRNSRRWMGMRQHQGDPTFVQFTQRKYGYQAGIVQICQYIGKGKDTIGKICAKWAPSADANNTQSYIDYVSRSSGIAANHVLEAEDRYSLVEIVMSIVHIECGIIEDRRLIEQAYDQALEEYLG